jgi:hypothetical protein
VIQEEVKMLALQEDEPNKTMPYAIEKALLGKVLAQLDEELKSRDLAIDRATVDYNRENRKLTQGLGVIFSRAEAVKEKIGSIKAHIFERRQVFQTQKNELERILD